MRPQLADQQRRTQSAVQLRARQRARGFTEADVTIEVNLQTSYEQHVAMEPHHVVAVWDRDQLTLHTGDQYTHASHQPMAQLFDIPRPSPRLFEDTGGGWGDKFGALPYRVIAAVLAKKTGRPVNGSSTVKTSSSMLGTTTR